MPDDYRIDDYVESFFRTIKNGLNEAVDKNIHYPLCGAACTTFLDAFGSYAGIKTGIFKEVNPLMLYSSSLTHMPVEQTILLFSGLVIGAISAGAILDELYSSYYIKKITEHDCSDDVITSSMNYGLAFFNREEMTNTKTLCYLKLASSGVGVGTIVTNLLF